MHIQNPMLSPSPMNKQASDKDAGVKLPYLHVKNPQVNDLFENQKLRINQIFQKKADQKHQQIQMIGNDAIGFASAAKD